MAEQTLKEKTAKGLFWGGINGGIQQILNVVFGVCLARLLSPGDYGLIGMLGIFMGIASTLQEAGFNTALINRREIKHEDYNSVFWFSLTVGICCYVILFFSAPLIADFFNQPELKNLSRILFLWFLIGSVSVSHSALLTKKLMVQERAKIEVSALLISGTVGVIMAFKGMAYWGIAIQTVTHAFVGTILRWYYVKWRPTFSFDIAPLREMFPFGVKILLTTIFTQINANIFSVLLGRFYREEQVGYYTQGNKWMNMGYSLIWSMLGSVSLPVLSEVSTDIDWQRQVFRKMLRFVCFISFPSMLGLALVAPELIEIGVSAKWLPCVPIMQLLCIWGAIMPIANLYTHILLSHGKSDIYFYNTLALGFVQIAVIISSLSWGISYMVLNFVIVNVLWLFIWHYFMNRYVQIKLITVLKDILPYLMTTLLVLSFTYLSTLWIHNIYLLFISKIVIAIVLYCTIMYVTKSVIFAEALQFVLNRKFSRK